MSLQTILKSNSLFSDCNEAQLQALTKSASSREIAPGQSLFYEGDESKSLFILKSGTIVLKKSASSGEEDLARIGSNSHLGEMTFLQGQKGSYEKRSASAEAVEACSLVEIPFAVLEDLIQKDSSFGLIFYRAVARNLSARIRKTGEDLASLKSLHLRHV